MKHLIKAAVLSGYIRLFGARNYNKYGGINNE